LVVSDGKQTWRTPTVKVSNSTSGKSGLWFYQIGEQQEFRKFAVSATPLAAGAGEATQDLGGPTGDYLAPDLPSPQDWVLVLERVK
jgi:hypothetical protein